MNKKLPAIGDLFGLDRDYFYEIGEPLYVVVDDEDRVITVYHDTPSTSKLAIQLPIFEKRNGRPVHVEKLEVLRADTDRLSREQKDKVGFYTPEGWYPYAVLIREQTNPPPAGK